ncbi:metalloendopeptidase [Homalodisca vitripennis]|nr:metalloendopeptidase [Homalodisca vitripennis]
MYLQRLWSTIVCSSRVNLQKVSSFGKVKCFPKQYLYSNPHISYTLNIFPRCTLQNVCNPICQRTFHTSNSNKALPPIIWIVLRSLLKFGAVLTGRGLRKWWASLPKNRREYILYQVKKNRTRIMWGSALSGGFVLVYYVSHLVEDPITKRVKFMLFSEKQIRQMANIECEVIIENYKNQIVTSGQQYNYVLKVAQRILQANSKLPGAKREWKVLIVDDKDTKNAFVLPSGHIFIFTGMLAAVSNEDQLAAIIAHEMSHALLSHSAEAASKTHLLEMLMLLPIVALWTLLPDSIAISSHYFTEYISTILFKLPFSRSLETEADTVGLEMVARACYDPRQASVFWRKMERLAEDEQIEWLSTHPSHKTRYETLDGLMPKAFSILTRYCSRSDPGPHAPSKMYCGV